MGQIVTFYSYKGGTGRSMALANTAWIMASRKKRVLVIDWDLEAPGLFRYFAPFLVDRGLTATKGVIEFVRTFAIRSVTPSGETLPKDWFVSIADIVDYAVSLRWKHFSPGTLDLIAAGQQDSSYATRVNSFDWDDFYEKRGGGIFLEKTRELLRNQYDYVLIDSRTGVSDTSGICTVHLPDAVVVCFTLNNQGIEGASSVAQSIAAQRTDDLGKSRIPILPVPMRTDTFEKTKLDKRRAYGREKFKTFLDRLPAGYWNDVEVPYWGYYGYEEVLATFGDEPNASSNSMLRSFENLTRHLTGGVVSSLFPPPAEERAGVLRFFEDGPPRDTAGAPVAAAPTPTADPALFDYYLSFHAQESGDAALLRQTLETRAACDFVNTDALLTDPNRGAAVDRALALSSAFLFCEGRFGWSPSQLKELAFAFTHQKREAAKGREFPVIPVIFPAASPTTSYLWLELNVVDLRRKIDDADKLMALTRRLGAGELRSFPSGAGANPFRGTMPYQEIDEPVFLGRNADLKSLAALLPDNPIVFLRGASGVGKSSLVNAGLKPFLRREANPSWEIVSFTPQTRPFSDLAAALVNLWTTETNETNRLLDVSNLSTALASGSVEWQSVLQLAFRGSSTGQRLLIVVDQVEALLTSATESERVPFLRLLGKFSEALPVTVLFLIRPEAEAAFAALMPSWEWPLRSGLVLEDMNGEAWAQIAGLQARFGVRPLPPDVVARAVATAEADAKPAGTTALLSTWLDSASRSRKAILVGRAERTALDSLISERPEVDRGILLSSLVRMVDLSQPGLIVSGHSPIYWDELDEEIRARFLPLVDRRILTTYLDTGRDRALIKVTALSASLQSLAFHSFVVVNFDFLRWRQQHSVRAILWNASGRAKELLLSEAELASADLFRSDADPNGDVATQRPKEFTAVELALLSESAAFHTREAQLREGVTEIVAPPAPVPSAFPTAAPPSEAGEFTRMFQNPATPQAAPPRPAAGEFTMVFGSPVPPQAAPPPAAVASPARQSRRRRWPWLVSGVAAVVLAGAGYYRWFGEARIASIDLPSTSPPPPDASKGDLPLVIAGSTKKIEAGDTSGYATRAYAYRLSGNFDAALSDYSRFLKIHPNDSQILAGTAYVYSLKKDYASAVNTLTAAISADPANSRHYIDRANAHAAMGDNKSALTDWNGALSVDPTSPLAQAGRIGALRALGARLGRADTVPTVYFELASELERTRANTLHAGLRELGYVVPELEIIGAQPGSPELRFHSPADQAQAERLGRDLKQLHFNVTLKDISGLPASAHAQAKSFELWFGNITPKEAK